jgi:hypothetical protein
MQSSGTIDYSVDPRGTELYYGIEPAQGYADFIVWVNSNEWTEENFKRYLYTVLNCNDIGDARLEIGRQYPEHSMFTVKVYMEVWYGEGIEVSGVLNVLSSTLKYADANDDANVESHTLVLKRGAEDQLLAIPAQYRITLDVDETEVRKSVETIENGKGVRCVRCGNCDTEVHKRHTLLEDAWAMCYHCRTKHVHNYTYHGVISSSDEEVIIHGIYTQLKEIDIDWYSHLYNRPQSDFGYVTIAEYNRQQYRVPSNGPLVADPSTVNEVAFTVFGNDVSPNRPV